MKILKIENSNDFNKYFEGATILKAYDVDDRIHIEFTNGTIVSLKREFIKVGLVTDTEQ